MMQYGNKEHLRVGIRPDCGYIHVWISPIAFCATAVIPVVHPLVQVGSGSVAPETFISDADKVVLIQRPAAKGARA
jgi:hypothetical protein